MKRTHYKICGSKAVSVRSNENKDFPIFTYSLLSDLGSDFEVFVFLSSLEKAGHKKIGYSVSAGNTFNDIATFNKAGWSLTGTENHKVLIFEKK